MSPERVTFSGEAVAACPDCDTAPVWRRDGDPQATHPEYEFACYECGWRGDDYRERDSRHNQHMDGNVKPRPGTLAHELAAADPDDLVTDGGYDQITCVKCNRRYSREQHDECPHCSHTALDEFAADGGEEIESEWAIDCQDCDWTETVVGTEHPAEGPPAEVEKKVRVHKNTADESHIVQVKGVHSPADREIDPSLVTDGGVPQFDRVATGFCESFGDEVAIRWLDGGECVGCRERRELVTDGGTDAFENDPNRLPIGWAPAVIGEHTEEGTVKLSVANVDLHESGALHYTQYDGRTGIIPEWRWTEVEYLDTETFAEDDQLGADMRRRVLARDWSLLPDPVREVHDPVDAVGEVEAP